MSRLTLERIGHLRTITAGTTPAARTLSADTLSTLFDYARLQAALEACEERLGGGRPPGEWPFVGVNLEAGKPDEWLVTGWVGVKIIARAWAPTPTEALLSLLSKLTGQEDGA